MFVKNTLNDDGVVSKRPASFGYNLVNVTPPQTVSFTASYNF